MSLDQRARNAAEVLRDGLERLPQPPSDAVVRRVRHRRRVTRSLVATALVAVVMVGIGAVVVSTAREGSAPIETTDGPEADLPDGAVVGQRWTMVPKQSGGLPEASAPTDVASTGTSFLVAGDAPTDEGTTAAIWRSEDGLHWQRAGHPRSEGADGAVHALATAGDTALAVGTDGGGGPTFVWRSTDGGRTWSEVAHGPELFGPPAPEMGRPFVDGLLHRAGWWIAHGGAADGYAGVWVSRDGEQWSQVLDSREAGSATVVAGAGDELFAHWARLGWFTTDPTSWGAPTELTRPDGFSIGAVAAGASLAVGASEESPTGSVLLRSADGGRSWRTDEAFSRQFPDAWLLAVGRTDHLWIAVGASGRPNRPAAWTSDDGRIWRALPPDLAGPPGGTLGLLATAGDTTVVFGTAPELDRYYVLRTDPG